MIHPQELRIGNWVQNPLGDYMQVKQLGHTDNPDYIFAKSDKGFGQNEFHPIPLTPELLEKCGFKEPNENDWHGGMLLDISDIVSIRLKPFVGGYYWDNFNGSFKVIVNNLHQLQNLYKSLTSKELNIQL